MRIPLSCSALGLALVIGAPVAEAQTIITPAVDQPVVTVPAETVQTTETVRTVRPAPRSARRQIVTTRTVTRQIVPSATVVARTIQTSPQPLYDEVAPVAAAPQPLYDEVTAPADATVVGPMIGSAPAGSEPYNYRYVYQPDRILVVDPVTGIAVQSLPR